jgi:hypothetical protein
MVDGGQLTFGITKFRKDVVMSRLNAACLILACLVCQRSAASANDKRSDQVPELAALEHYAGSWESETDSANLPFTKGKVTAQWILGGRFLQQSVEVIDGSADWKYLSLMTYDPEKKVYRTWIFLSDGSTMETEGTWDENRRVMTSVGRKDANGGHSITTADFSEAGVEKWKIAYKDQNGTVVTEISGKNTRQRE